MKYRLGLDLGTNSIGWAIWKLGEREVETLADMGVRIFSDGCDPSGESLAVTRRNARGARRLRMRGKRRRSSLFHLLQQCNLLPSGEDEIKTLFDSTNPYQLRYEGLRRTLSAHELGRVLLQLGQRRGFKSNRISKAQEVDAESASDDKKFHDGIALLKKEIKEGEMSTLGEFLYSQQRDEVRLRFHKNSPYRADREIYLNEWNCLRKRQEGDHPDIPWDKLCRTVFSQRPLAKQDRGRCEFFPDEPRGYKAMPSFQNFRILQTLHDLRYQDPQKGLLGVELSLAEKQKIFDLLQRQKSLAFSKIAKECDLPAGGKFNFESETKKGLVGNETSVEMQKKGSLGSLWFTLSAEEQDEIVEDLLSPEIKNEKKLENYLLEKGASKEQIQTVKKIDFVKGVGRLSTRAMRQLNERMQREQESYTQACESLGWHHSDHAYKGELEEFLPYYGKILNRACVDVYRKDDPNRSVDADEREFGKIGNPRVHVALRQLERVVNALIERYGRPSQIVVEATRELKASRDSRKNIEIQQKKGLKENERINKIYRENGFTYPSRKDRQKYKLWEELQINTTHNCLYCGENISFSQLLSEKTEVDHILPFSQTMDDSMSNKTVVHRQCNQRKGNRSPFDAFSQNSEEWESLQQRIMISKIKPVKRQRFAQDALEKFQDEKKFLARHGNDTAYISRLARQYLAAICPYSKINLSPGILTDMIRGSLSLNYFLNNGKTEVERRWRKNRSDHRHHAIDAAVVGLMTPRYLKEMALLNRKIDEYGGESLHTRVKEDKIELKLPDFPLSHREMEAMLDKILISFKPEHGDNGPFFKDTAMGISFRKRTIPFSELKEGHDLIDRELKDLLTSQKPESFNAKKKALLKEKPEYSTKEMTYREFSWTTHKEPLESLKENEIKRVYDEKLQAQLRELAEEPGKWEEKIKEFSEREGIRRVKFIPNSQIAFPLPIHSPSTAMNAQEAYYRGSPVQKGYAPDGYACALIWQMPSKQEKREEKREKTGEKRDLVSHFYTYFETQLLKNQREEFARPHPSAKKLLTLYKQDILHLTPHDGSQPYYVRVAGFSVTRNKLDLQPLFAAKDHVDWRNKTNPRRVLWGSRTSSPQNFKAINALFKENTVRRGGLDVLGKPIYFKKRG